MIVEYSAITKLFKELDSAARIKMNIYMIGGGAMMKHNFKAETKDIDLVVNTYEEFAEFSSLMERLNFNSQRPEPEYSRMNVSQVFVRGDYRIDIFFNKVCRKLAFSEGMVRRSLLDASFEKIDLYICALEDILLFKSITDREGDLEDCIKILYNHKNDWNVILEEAKDQSKKGEEVWITWITSRFEDLSERGAVIPILPELRKLSDEYITKMEESLTPLLEEEDKDN